MGGMSGGQLGTHVAQVHGGVVQYPICVPASQLAWFELVRAKLEQPCCASRAAMQKEVGCPAALQELLLPG